MASGMTCGEALLHLLKAYDVDTVFGIPGYHTVEFYRGFDKVGLRQVTPRHEQGSALWGLRLCPGHRQAGGVLSGDRTRADQRLHGHR